MKTSTPVKTTDTKKTTKPVVMSAEKLAKLNQQHSADVLYFINVRCGVRQTTKSSEHTNALLSANNADDGMADVTLYKLPPEVKSVKKWIENTRRNVVYSACGGKKYKHNGRLGSLVSPEHQEAFLEYANEFVNKANRRILNAATDSNTEDRQAGYEKMLSRFTRASGSFDHSQDLPVDYQSFVDNIKVYIRTVPYSVTPDFARINKAVQKAIIDTANDDACEAYNGTIDGIETALKRTLLKLKQVHSAKPKSSTDNKFKWPVLTNNTLNTYLFTPMETYLPLLPKDTSTNALFNVAWAILGSTPKDMRQFFIDTNQIGESDKDWQARIAKNPKFGKTNPGIQGLWAKLFDNEKFKALPVNAHQAKVIAAEEKTALSKQNQVKYIMEHDMLGKRLRQLYEVVQSIPRIEVDR